MNLFLLLVFCVVGVDESYADLAKMILPAEYVNLWFLRLLLNLLGYGTIIVPGYLLIKYFKKVKYDEQHRGDGKYKLSPVMLHTRAEQDHKLLQIFFHMPSTILVTVYGFCFGRP